MVKSHKLIFTKYYLVIILTLCISMWYYGAIGAFTLFLQMTLVIDAE